MRHADDEWALLLLAQKFHDAAGHAHRIEILHRFKIVRRNQSLRTDSHSEQTNAHAANYLNRVRLDLVFQRLPRTS